MITYSNFYLQLTSLSVLIFTNSIKINILNQSFYLHKYLRVPIQGLFSINCLVYIDIYNQLYNLHLLPKVLPKSESKTTYKILIFN